MRIVIDGDRNFTAVNERQDPGQLQPGVLSCGINIDLTRGEIESRKGIKATRSLAGKCVDLPAKFPVKFDTLAGHGQIYGAARYTSQFGYFYTLLILERYALRLHESGAYLLLQYPVDLRITDDVEVIQAFNNVYLFRGEFAPTLVWNGSERGVSAFTEVVTTGLAPGVEPMPKSSVALYYKNRLWVLKGKDEVVFSDIGSETVFSLQNQFKIDSGSFDRVRALKAFGDHSIVVFKERSIDLIENLVGDITDNAVRTRLSNEIGLASPSCVTDVGRDLWFLSERGVFSVKQARDNKLQSDSEPISAPMQPVFDRINWNVKDQFRTAYFENKFVLACALDDATTNDTLIVYSFLTQSWHGIMQASFLDAERLFTNVVDNEGRLFFVTNDGIVNQVFTGIDDDPLTGVQEFTSTAITRGYGAADLERKHFRTLTTDISTCRPSYTLTVSTEGINEDQDLLPAPTTYDPKRYQTVGKPDFVLRNTNDDYNDAYREDYCLCLDGVCATFPSCFPVKFRASPADPNATFEICLGDNGACPDLLQRFQDPRALNAKGDYMTVKIVNTSGKFKVHSYKIKAFTTNETMTVSV